ncbi:MAG: hypothetical protein HUK00_05005 [Bacteroidaceae bacterium]|nr:hypothetical protein [Bacteroidaceae bacterium]MCF0194518.1 hypothetical protein [Bacteroidaceae bacterium]
MFTITANEKGSREIQVSEDHLATIDRYSLFADLLASHGIVTDHTLEHLRLNVRSLVEANPDEPALIALLSDVLYHKDMKAFGLHQLINLYLHWNKQ